jgi:hypothetical protein
MLDQDGGAEVVLDFRGGGEGERELAHLASIRVGEIRPVKSRAVPWR